MGALMVSYGSSRVAFLLVLPGREVSGCSSVSQTQRPFEERELPRILCSRDHLTLLCQMVATLITVSCLLPFQSDSIPLIFAPTQPESIFLFASRADS